VSPRDGRAIRFDAVISDVTDRRLAEEALLDQRAMLQNVIDHTPCAVFWKDRSSVYLGCNVQSAQDLGLASPDEAIGKTDRQMPFSPEEADFYVACDRRVMETGQALLRFEETQQRPDGSSAILLTSKVPLRSACGDVVGVLGVYTDITERKRMEEALRQSEQRYREVVEGSIQGILIHQEGKIEFVNRSLARMFGYEDPAELLGLSPDVLIAPEDRPLLHSRRQRCLGGEPLPLIEWQGLRKDGSRVWIQSTVTTIVWNGRPALLSTRLDITERKALEEQLRQAQKMEAVGRLAGGIAHDFNNFIQIITGCGEVVLGDLPAVHPCRDMIREMKNAGDRAAGLTRQLLAFSRRQILAPHLLDLSVVAQDASRLLERLIGEDIELVTASEPGLAPVRADPNQVEQVLLNLAVNARDAMPHGGKLTIETRNVELDEAYVRSNPEARPGPHVLLAVSDIGCGMDEATRARIFEPFFTTKGECGTGLGLATVYGIVRQSGGHVAVYSEVGRGTTFKIYLPRAGEVTKARKSEARHGAMPRGTETVLLVEDEDGVRALASHVLRDCGYVVLEARHGKEALRVAAEHEGSIKLLVTDVVMPHLGGRELAERLALSHPQARVLFLSGYTDDAIVRHGILEEEVAFLQKPFTTAALARKVREVLDG
jgi:PAS domain S-box-containing protein